MLKRLDTQDKHNILVIAGLIVILIGTINLWYLVAVLVVASIVGASVILKMPVKSASIETIAPIVPKTVIRSYKTGDVHLNDTYKFNLTKASMFVSALKGYGKTNTLYVILDEIIRHSDPDRLKVCIIDLKEVSFNVYHTVPHIFNNKVYTSANGVTAMVKEFERRKGLYQQIEGKLVTSLGRYNKHRGKLPYLPHIIVMVDEVNELGKTAAKGLDTMNQLARSFGITVVAATRRCTADYINVGQLSQYDYRAIGYMVNNDEYRYAGLGKDTIPQMKAKEGYMAFLTSSKWIVCQVRFMKEGDIEALCATYDTHELVGDQVQKNSIVFMYFSTLTRKPKLTELMVYYSISEEEARRYLKMWARR